MASDKKEEAWELILKAAQMNGKPLTKDLEMCQVEMQQISIMYILNVGCVKIWQEYI